MTALHRCEAAVNLLPEFPEVYTGTRCFIINVTKTNEYEI